MAAPHDIAFLWWDAADDEYSAAMHPRDAEAALYVFGGEVSARLNNGQRVVYAMLPAPRIDQKRVAHLGCD